MAPYDGNQSKKKKAALATEAWQLHVQNERLARVGVNAASLSLLM